MAQGLTESEIILTFHTKNIFPTLAISDLIMISVWLINIQRLIHITIQVKKLKYKSNLVKLECMKIKVSNHKKGDKSISIWFKN